MNWLNVKEILNIYTQYRHYLILFNSQGWKFKSSRSEMLDTLREAVTDEGFLGPAFSQTALQDWLALHQIDGNNYTFVYDLRDKPAASVLKALYEKRDEYVTPLWEFNPQNESEDIATVTPNLTSVTLTGIDRNQSAGTYTFSFVAPCLVNGKNEYGAPRVFKKLFFAHVVLFDATLDLKVVFNPTANLINVCGEEKLKGHDWTPIADLFFTVVKNYIGGNINIKSPDWIPGALFQLAEDASRHNNQEVTEKSVNAQQDIDEFAHELFNQSGLDADKHPALVSRFIQDIQQSFEAQLIEELGVIEEEDSFQLFRQRSDGVEHVINVESKSQGLVGSAAQAARRTRQDADIDLIGVTLKRNGNVYKFLVEHGRDSYLIRGTNAFVEEEVVNIVIRKLNEYRGKIQSAIYSP